MSSKFDATGGKQAATVHPGTKLLPGLEASQTRSHLNQSEAGHGDRVRQMVCSRVAVQHEACQGTTAEAKKAQTYSCICH